MMPVAILAGGLGTRLGELTKDKPKSLVDVVGRPFVEHQLELLRQAGVSLVVMCVSHMCTEIRWVVDNGKRLGIKVYYSYDDQLGTGGALVKALPLLGDEFFVLYGDTYLNCDYVGVETRFRASGKHGMMCIYRNEDRWGKSNVAYHNGTILGYTKRQNLPNMHYIDAGLSAFKSIAFSRFPGWKREGFCGDKLDLEDIFNGLLDANQLAAYEVKNRFYEIGTVEGLMETREYIEKTEYLHQYRDATVSILQQLDLIMINRMVELLAEAKDKKGRVFFLGVGGSAANCSHAVNDFRKKCHIEAYASTDNIAEVTARTNDNGWDSTFIEWLRTSRLCDKDLVFVLSVSGGILNGVSRNIALAVNYAAECRAKIIGIVGNVDGVTTQRADACIIIPAIEGQSITAHAEEMQSVILHMLAFHLRLNVGG